MCWLIPIQGLDQLHRLLDRWAECQGSKARFQTFLGLRSRKKSSWQLPRPVLGGHHHHPMKNGSTAEAAREVRCYVTKQFCVCPNHRTCHYAPPVHDHYMRFWSVNRFLTSEQLLQTFSSLGSAKLLIRRAENIFCCKPSDWHPKPESFNWSQPPPIGSNQEKPSALTLAIWPTITIDKPSPTIVNHAYPWWSITRYT